MAIPSLTLAIALAACGSSEASTSTPPSSTSSTAASSATSSSSSSAGAQSAAGTAKVTISPAHGMVGTIVHVVGSGYAPNIQLTGTLCAVDASGVVENPLTDCDVLDVVVVVTDASGAFTSDYTIKRIPPPKAGYQVGYGQLGNSAQSAGASFTVDR